ncbi:MAG: NAD-glutamate dehydrogenase domain-containing protein, partial [Pseudomonadota bacterium]
MDRQPADEAKTTPINLQNVLADAKREAAGEQVGAVALADFIDLVFGRIPPEELGRRTADHIAFSAASLLRFTSVADPARQPARAKLAITPVDNRRAGVPAHTAIEVNAPDRPFIIASLLGELRAQGHSVDLLVHPILWTERDASGSLQNIVAAGAGANGALNQESVVRIEIEPLADQSALDRLEAGLTATLQDLDAAVTDWPAMRDALQATAQGLSEVNAPDTKNDLEEARHFVDWLLADNFILLGMRDYRLTPGNGAATLTVVPDRSLGILRDSDRRIVHNEGTKAEAPPSSAPLFVAKSTLRSRIHRPAHLDFISLRSYSATGDVVGECRFVGLFTATAYNQSVATIPLLRRKADAVITASGIDTPGHDQNVLRNIVETYPRDELFQIDGETLSRIAIGIMRLGDRPRPRLFLRRDPYDRFASILVYIPRDRFSSAMRELVGQNLAKAQHGRVSAFYTELGDQPLTRVQFIIGLDPGTGPRPDEADLEALLVDTVRSWRDGLKDALDAALPEAQAAAHYAAYAGAFPAAYQEAHTAEKAVRDILDLESMAEGEESLFRCLASTPENPRSTIAIRIFRRGSPVPLSDIVPVMENMGLRIISEAPFKLRPGLERSSTSEIVYLHDFCALPAGKQADGPIEISEETARSVEETLSRVWRGEAENDGFNALAFDADLTWDEITLIRALAKYRLQAGSAFSQAYMQEAFAANPRLAQLVVAYFMALHAPDRPETKPAGPSAEALLEDIMAGLDGVESSDHDRILRLFINLVGQVRRTNLFRREAGERRPTIALKFDPTGIDELPPPHAYAEVFVYAPSVEGVHFRFGKIARGGLRWSGRREDFRTEVLGLVKAQQVKNAVIVPVGAKGGFYAKAVPAGATRDQEIAAGIDAYKLFIGGLLDLTDNLEQGNEQQKVLPPPGVSRPDGDDPYLVVAADKGTATFSDIANDVAGSYGFWLGDAFASGGSNGYDHKAMGITARGAWEAVKRHFRELGHDTQTQHFTVAGVGDMSGDVFGNGMLLSEHIQLVAAFDHRHIFIDPTPDIARSFAERQRIFALPRSSWADYDTSLISPGGGVFPRSAKRIALTDEMRRCLGTDATQLAPTELIRAVLSAPVDLLWFGGIGTYIKAEHERDFDVGDRANDQVRIDTRALRARVIGEGANLGLTQQGRVEAGRRGVALNTDAVDNSAGVDCSDHEVNIKILLDSVKREGQITDTERNDRLKAMTEDVAELVLATNYEQTLAISLAEATAVPDLDAARRLIQRFESRGVLDRALENLPS